MSIWIALYLIKVSVWFSPVPLRAIQFYSCVNVGTDESVCKERFNNK